MAIKELSNVQVKSGSDWYKLCPFPVGYIYMGYTSTSPATTYGGTWSSISGGKYFRAAAANNAAGSNTIAVENMPSHTHNFVDYAWARLVGQTNWETTTAFATANHEGVADLTNPNNVSYTGGGGRRFIQHIKTSMLGDAPLNLWKEGGVND